MLTLGGIAVADHGGHPPGALPGAVATAPAARGARRRDLGVRAGGLPRHPADHRDHRRPPGDARHRDRLRDPDARARRGGGGDRPRRAPDPGDRPQPRPRPARGHLRRHLRLRRAALRQGADAPRLRPAARGRHRRDLPLRRSSCRSPSSASASTSRPPRAATSAPARLGRLVVWLGSIPSRRCRAVRGGQRRHLHRRRRGRGQAHPADRPGPVGEPGQPGHQGPPQGREADRRSSELGVYATSRRRVLATRSRPSPTTSPASSCASTRRRCSPVRASRRPSATS